MGLTGGGHWAKWPKLHENYKVDIFGSKQWGCMGGQANFSGSGENPPQPPLEYLLFL